MTQLFVTLSRPKGDRACPAFIEGPTKTIALSAGLKPRTTLPIAHAP